MLPTSSAGDDTILAQNVEQVASMTEQNVAVVTQTESMVDRLTSIVERMKQVRWNQFWSDPPRERHEGGRGFRLAFARSAFRPQRSIIVKWWVLNIKSVLEPATCAVPGFRPRRNVARAGTRRCNYKKTVQRSRSMAGRRTAGDQSRLLPMSGPMGSRRGARVQPVPWVGAGGCRGDRFGLPLAVVCWTENRKLNPE